jgi:ribosome-binding factor A
MSRRSKDHKSSPHHGLGPSQRQLRAAEMVRHALVEILAREEFMDPALKGVSITLGEVRASPDLKHMHAFVAPLGKGDPAVIAEALNRARGFLRGLLGRRIDIKYTPELHFLPDMSYDEATRIDALLRQPQVRRDLDHDGES